jgi:prepilin-type N-terminal cleavage/methylation domain-containing protein
MRQAFTLVELAIVLVIIGLLVGGVLVAQDLILAAQMRKQVTQLDEYAIAAQAFRLKYNCIPGDCLNATYYFASGAQPEAVTNGNGNGMIDRGAIATGCNYGYFSGQEWRYAFDHLAAAQMVKYGQYDETNVSSNTTVAGNAGSMPLCAWLARGTTVYTTQVGAQNCGVIMAYEFKRHYFRLGAMGNLLATSYTLLGMGMTAPDASSFDDKFDDGLPLTGNMVVAPLQYQCGWSPTTPGWEGLDLTNNPTYGTIGCTSAVGVNSWTSNSVHITQRRCSLRINASF